MGKRGRKAEKSWTIKFQRGKHYLNTWQYNYSKTERKRDEIRRAVKNGSVSEVTDKNVWHKASQYDFTSRGRIYFDIINRTFDKQGNVHYEVVLKGHPTKKNTAMDYVMRQPNMVELLEEIKLDIEARLARYENDEDERRKFENGGTSRVEPVEVVRYIRELKQNEAPSA